MFIHTTFPEPLDVTLSAGTQKVYRRRIVQSYWDKTFHEQLSDSIIELKVAVNSFRLLSEEIHKDTVIYNVLKAC